MSDSLVKWVLDLDVSKFTENMRKAGDELSKLADDNQLSGLLGTVESVGKGFLAWEGAKIVSELTEKVISAGLEMSKLSEEVRAAQKQFEILAQGSGLSAKTLETGLKKVADGLVTDTELLNAASKSVVAIGANAQRLPELFEIARKASATFGGTATENLEKINLAIESGNTRVLRQMGLWFNATDAIKKYAHEHSLQVEQLSEEAKQQAILEAVLDKSKKQYADIDVNQKQLSNNLQRFTTALTEMKEVGAQVFDKYLGPSISHVVDLLQKGTRAAVEFTKSFFDIGQSAEQVDSKMKGITDQIAKLEAKKSNQSFLFDQYDQARLDGLNKQLQTLQASKKKIVEEDKKDAEQAATAGGIKLTKEIDPQEQAKAQAKYYEELSKLNEEYVQERIKSANTIQEWDSAKAAEKVAETQKYDAQLKTLEAQNQANYLITSDQKLKMEQALQQEHTQKLLEIDRQYQDERIKKEVEFRDKVLKTQDDFGSGWKLASNHATQDVKVFQKGGETAFNSLGSHGKKAFMDIGSGAKSGGDAMKEALYGTLGDVAAAFGEFYLAKGIAEVADFNPAGGVHIAEGGALLALAGFLGSQSSGGSASSSSDAGGVSGAGPGSSNGVVNPSSSSSIDTTPQTPRKTVTIQVAGPLITDETKTRFLEIMRQATDDTDFKYQQIGVG